MSIVHLRRNIPRRALLVAGCCLALAGCFEEPVREHLHLSLLGPGGVVVTVIQEVAEPELGRSNPTLARRMDEARRTIEDGSDSWGQRFAALQPLAEHRSIERVDGRLRRSVRSAAFASFDDGARLLEADGLGGSLEVAGGTAELQLFPTGGSRATAVQRQKVERLLNTWSEALAAYLAATVELYRHLEGRPDRAVPCLAHVFGTRAEDAGPLTADEELLVGRVTETVERVAEALLIADGEAFSLNELSRLVYDPFPARLTLSVQGRVLGTAGLVATGGAFERPAIDAWNALRSLEGRWLAPDLVTALAAPLPEERQPEPDPAAFAALPRYIGSPPSPVEVESALLSELVAVPAIGLRWLPVTAGDDSAEIRGEAWLAVLAAAAASVPD